MSQNIQNRRGAGRLAYVVRLLGLPLLWQVTILLMVQDYLDDPYDPARQGTSAYGHNHEGALLQGIVMTVLELAVVVAILRPWSYRRSWLRGVLALVVFLPWTVASMVMTMHAGGVVVIHFLWLFVLVLVLVSGTLWSAIAAAWQQRRAAGAP